MAHISHFLCLHHPAQCSSVTVSICYSQIKKRESCIIYHENLQNLSLLTNNRVNFELLFYNLIIVELDKSQIMNALLLLTTIIYCICPYGIFLFIFF